jgi:hypothetical protein
MTKIKKLQVVGQAIALIETFIHDYKLNKDHYAFDYLADLRNLVKDLKT